MERQITELLKTVISTSGLTWLDVVCGMVETVQMKATTPDGTVTHAVPAYRQPGQTGCNKGNDYTLCVPDTSDRSIVYIEAERPNVIKVTTHYDEYTLPVTIVGWLNLKQINVAYENASGLVDELLSVIGSSLPNSAPYNTIRVDMTGSSRDLSVVNKYDYNEAENQMWIYPFDFFTIGLNITFRRKHVCHGSTSLDPSACKTY